MTSPSAEELLRSMKPPPPRANGWWLLSWSGFQQQLRTVVEEVERLRDRDPEGYGSHPKAKLLATILRIIREDIPRDPSDPAYRQGTTLGAAYTSWHRAKFHQRWRLFYRFRSADRVIVYGWMNLDTGLRKAGDKNDPYQVFRKMLDRGTPPTDFNDLLRASGALHLPPGQQPGSADQVSLP